MTTGRTITPLYTIVVACPKDSPRPLSEHDSSSYFGALNENEAVAFYIRELNEAEAKVERPADAENGPHPSDVPLVWTRETFDEAYSWAVFHAGDTLSAVLACRMTEELVADMNTGQVPEDVGSFSEIHDHIDANELALEFALSVPGVRGIDNAAVEVMNAAQGMVDAYLKEVRRQVEKKEKEDEIDTATVPTQRFAVRRTDGNAYHVTQERALCAHALSKDGSFSTSCEEDACLVVAEAADLDGLREWAVERFGKDVRYDG